MNGFFIRWLILGFSISTAAYLMDGIHVSGVFSAFAAAAMLGILNAVFRPIALIITLPINILSFGLFTFVINAAMLKMASALIAGFDVIGFWSAVFGSLLISIVSFVINAFISDRGTVEYIELRHKGGDRWEV
ncbi:MAG: phage holin family protein [Desulfobacterales bacterium]|nr:phage holin family protein [Desulfobacterales bacterium]